MQAETDINRPT